MHEIKLRPWVLSDLNDLVQFANNWNIAQFMSDQFPFPHLEEKGRAFIEFANKGNPIHIFAIDLKGQAIGGMGLHPQTDIHKRNAEIGYWLAEPFWGQGIVSSLIPKLIQFGFEELDINRIFARAFGRNIASQRVLEKTGFQLEAKFEKTIFKNGAFEDELIYGYRKSD